MPLAAKITQRVPVQLVSCEVPNRKGADIICQKVLAEKSPHIRHVREYAMKLGIEPIVAIKMDPTDLPDWIAGDDERLMKAANDKEMKELSRKAYDKACKLAGSQRFINSRDSFKAMKKLGKFQKESGGLVVAMEDRNGTICTGEELNKVLAETVVDVRGSETENKPTEMPFKPLLTDEKEIDEAVEFVFSRMRAEKAISLDLVSYKFFI